MTFRSTRITGTPQSFEITGERTVKGQTQPVTVPGREMAARSCARLGDPYAVHMGNQALHRIPVDGLG
ncbi:YceI family protein [Streptomyces sp. NBC_01361]